MRRFFGSFTSSFSLSLASLLVPALLLDTLFGVSGGVVSFSPVTLPEFVAAIEGTLPEISVGLLTTPVGTDEACVAIEEVEFDLAGEEGRCDTNGAEAGGEGAVNELAEFRC